MRMGFWQWVVVGMWITQLIISAALHGMPKVKRDGTPQTVRFEQELVSVLIGFIILYFGGFFK